MWPYCIELSRVEKEIVWFQALFVAPRLQRLISSAYPQPALPGIRKLDQLLYWVDLPWPLFPLHQSVQSVRPRAPDLVDFLVSEWITELLNRLVERRFQSARGEWSHRIDIQGVVPKSPMESAKVQTFAVSLDTRDGPRTQLWRAIL